MSRSLYTPGLLMQRLRDGEHIDTDDLIYLKNRLDRVVVALSGFGDRYDLVVPDAAATSANIRGYLRARESK